MADDALSYIQNLLESYGLGSLTQSAWDQITQGNLSADQTIQWLRTTPEYKTRFAGLIKRQQLGLPPISEAAVISYEDQATQILRGAGIPEQFYNNYQDFADMIAGDVSVNELQQRVQMAHDAVANKYDLELARLYGISPGTLVANEFLDPTKAEPLLRKEFEAAQSSTIAGQAGYGQLNQTEAERVGQAGLSTAQQIQTFGTLAQNQELYNAQTAGEVDIGRDVQLAGAVEGSAAAQAELDRRKARRAAQFQQGGGFVSSQQGLVGVQ